MKACGVVVLSASAVARTSAIRSWRVLVSAEIAHLGLPCHDYRKDVLGGKDILFQPGDGDTVLAVTDTGPQVSLGDPWELPGDMPEAMLADRVTGLVVRLCCCCR